MLECKSPQELQRFADKNIRPASGHLSTACVAEIGALFKLIQDCFPVPASRVIQVIWARPHSPKEAIPSSWRQWTSTGQGHMFKGQCCLLHGVTQLARSSLKCQGRLQAGGAGTQPCDSWSPLRLAIFARGMKVPLHWQDQRIGLHLTDICKCLREFQAKEVSLFPRALFHAWAICLWK